MNFNNIVNPVYPKILSFQWSIITVRHFTLFLHAKSLHLQHLQIYIFYICTFFFPVVGFELRASHLLGRRSTPRATPPVNFNH
jgi:hypothetical protein